MRLTRIYLKRISRFRLLLMGAVLGAAGAYFLSGNTADPAQSQTASYSSVPDLKIQLFKRFGSDSYIQFIDNSGKVTDSNKLIAQGYNIEVINSCKMRIYRGAENAIVTC